MTNASREPDTYASSSEAGFSEDALFFSASGVWQDCSGSAVLDLTDGIAAILMKETQ